MNKFMPLALTAMLALAGCNDARDAVPVEGAAPAAESSTARETREAVDALREAGRETGEAAASAAQDVRKAAGPALDEAREAGGRALDAAEDGLNDLTRGAACQTSRAAGDAEGVAANC